MKKRTVPAGGTAGSGVRHLAAVESKVFSQLHKLIEHCAVTQYDDGTPRRPGWFTVSTMGSGWKIVIKEPDTCLQMMTTAQTLDDALILADLLLASEEAPWEPDPFARAQESRKKKGS